MIFQQGFSLEILMVSMERNHSFHRRRGRIPQLLKKKRMRKKKTDGDE